MKKQKKLSGKKSEKSKKFKILAAGDFHGDNKITQKLAEKAVKENVDLVVLTGDITGLVETDNIIKPFIEKGKRVVFVPGNWEDEPTADFLSKLYGVKNVGDHYVKYGNVGIFGIGSAGVLSLNEERAFKKLKKDFKKIKNLEKKILISHIHAKGTKSEFSGIEGSSGVRKAIDEFQPDVFLSGHIHEGEGLSERIGRTRVYNVGKKGKIIEL
jgi:Icc-related predicted phosphoesterase